MFSLVEFAVSLGVLTTLVTALSACVCGCKNSNQKSELVGTAGVVKIRFDEEAPSPTPTTPASVKRASTQNSQRSLPEIPHPVGRHDSGDTASEIYATVNIDEGSKVAAAASTSREHPYEHAYAKLQKQIDSHNVSVEITPVQASDDAGVESLEAAGPESVVISASVAISGQLPSSQELPYITPPSPRQDTAAHFSGDSTDSAKGYTSISVREPLSNIRAQSDKPSALQPHYATVSDDSDEMYAAIEEASVGEGSDTYAQIAPEPRRRAAPVEGPATHHARRSAPPEIGASTSNATHSRQASSSSCSNSTGALGSPKPEKRSANSPLPPPPSATHAPHNAPHNATHAPHNATHAPHNTTHSTTHAPHPHTSHPSHPVQQRIADQRQHQRISSTGDLFNNDKLRRSLNEKHQRNNSCVSSSDFYGCNYPVDKHRYSSGDLLRPLTREPDAAPARNLDDMYAKVVKRAKKRPDDPGYETIDRNNAAHYETIARKQRTNSNQDPGYETVRDVNKANYNNNLKLTDSGPNSLISSDAGYEHISKGAASDSDPNYEVLRNRPPTPPAYSTVNKRPADPWPNNNDPGHYSDPDPNYETLNSQDPNYESLRLKDPKYESLRSKDSTYDSVRSKKDPNYESVKYFDVSHRDPPYERVNDKASSDLERSDSSAGYEKINVPNNREPKSSINGADATVSDYFQV